MNISPEGIEITKRFFEAIEFLKFRGDIRGLQTFTRAHDINRWNLNKVKFNPESSMMKTEYLAYLVQDYGISAHWLLTGSGPMFNNK